MFFLYKYIIDAGKINEQPTTKFANSPTNAVEVDLKGIPVQKAETLLRKAELPMIVRIFHDRIRIHVRTVDMEEIPAIGQNFSQLKKLTEGGK